MPKRRFADDDTPAAPAANHGLCSANGCFLPGDMSHATGEGQWLCHWHFWHSGQADKVTLALRRNEGLARFLAFRDAPFSLVGADDEAEALGGDIEALRRLLAKRVGAMLGEQQAAKSGPGAKERIAAHRARFASVSDYLPDAADTFRSWAEAEGAA